MNPWHLVWIIPLSAFAGFSLCAMLTVAKQADEYMDYDC